MTYYRDPEQHKSYKVEPGKPGRPTYIYWVQVHKDFGTGAFIHARGRDVVDHPDKAKHLLEATAKPATEQHYINALKDYFAIDKKVREQFIETYKL